MKTVLISIFISLQLFAFSQITLEATYEGSAGFSQVKEGEFRFYNYDTTSRQCIIYNEQHQQLNAISLGLTDAQYLSSINYVSESLFNVDENIELLFTYSEWIEIDTIWYLTYNSKIINEDGDMLLEIPGAQYNSITATNSGSELLAWIYDFAISSYPIETLVYHLPGTYSDIKAKNADEQIAAWPNPCSQQIYLPVNELGEILIIYNEQGKLIDQIKSSDTESSIKYSVNHLSSGLYFYQSVLNNAKGKMNKFIIK